MARTQAGDVSELPPSPGEGGPPGPAHQQPAQGDDAAADFAPRYTDTHDDFAPRDERAFAEPFPWPPAEGESVLVALARTWREVMFSPVSFYRRMPGQARLGPAVVYAVIMAVLGSGIRLFWGMLALAVWPSVSPDSPASIFVPSSAGDALLSFFFAPLLLLFTLFTGAAVTHALLKLMSAAGERYNATVRVFAYGQSVGLLGIVPIAGTVVGAAWAFVLAVIGLREVHRTSTAKAVLALLIPVFVLFFFFLMLVVIAVLAAALVM